MSSGDMVGMVTIRFVASTAIRRSCTCMLVRALQAGAHQRVEVRGEEAVCPVLSATRPWA